MPHISCRIFYFLWHFCWSQTFLVGVKKLAQAITELQDVAVDVRQCLSKTGKYFCNSSCLALAKLFEKYLEIRQSVCPAE
jgi:hypothetical protein